MKLKRFADELKKRKISAAVLLTSSMNKHDSNIVYLTGVDLLDFSCLIVRSDGKATFLVGAHEYAGAKRESMVKDVKSLDSNLFTFLKNNIKGKTIAINERILSVREYKKLKKLGKNIVDVSDMLMELRQVKTRKEIGLLSTACGLADTIFKDTVKNFSIFKTEIDVSAFILDRIAKIGCKPSFNPIVAFGKNAHDVHHTPDNTRLGKGFVLLDFGVKYKNYCSDISRTIYRGKPTRTEQEFYDLVRDVQEKTLMRCRQGETGKGLDAYAREIMGKVSRNFVHGLGHQIGIDVHESSYNLNKKGNFKLKQGMVVTIEPGIYFKGKLGIRIEDTVIVQKSGCKQLTCSTKKLLRV